MKLVKGPNFCSFVKLNVIIKDKKEVMEEARKDKPGLAFKTDGSKLDQGYTTAVVYWEDKLAAK